VLRHRFSEIYICRTFIFDLHRKFVFLDFSARKRNIFSRPEMRPACCNQQYSMMWFDSNEAVEVLELIIGGC
jgi:hypothetical protein